MSKRNPKSAYPLPKHQKKIVLCLTKHDPMTMSETNRKLKGENTSTTRAFHELESKGIVTAIDKEEYHGRKFSKYWLTQKGIFVALFEGADPDQLLQRTLKNYPNDKTLQCCLELSPLLGLEGFKIGLSAIEEKGKLDDSDTKKILIAHIQKEVSIEQIRKLIEILKKYPKEYHKTKEGLSKFSKSLTEALESLF